MSTVGQQLFFQITAGLWSTLGGEALINGLQQVLPNLSPGAPVALHGFAPGNGQPRGLALVVTIPPSITFVRKRSLDPGAGMVIDARNLTSPCLDSEGARQNRPSERETVGRAE
jgi:hypothetical protein